MREESSQSLRQRRYRQHKSGNHADCLPDRECRRMPPQNLVNSGSNMVNSGPLSPRDAMQREVNRVIARLDVLHQALVERPLDVELLSECRGQQRVLTSLAAALAKSAPATPATQIRENPLEALRRDIAARKAAAGSQ